ncbi:hypothetical protein [Anaerorhabdus furcosa]|uniref:Uncharacterized protein n=1 Tax=Anaerorhabdus furcosa TaxID=118967 RepID=A0A1T4KBX2_9FIRM|nr:hypothetical protein [Anaerorhabdus furcosa]SJZ39919.1 hypothetical protein SAMN02745191_0463 [Anaerorhabdus furcosa]
MIKKLSLMFLSLCLLCISGCATKQFERGTFTEGVYKNTFFELELNYPTNWVETGKDSVAFLYGCQLVEGEEWMETFEECKSAQNTNYFWDLALESNEGKNFSGILIEDTSTRSSKPTIEDVLAEQVEAAKKWAGDDVVVSDMKDLTIDGKIFKMFTYEAKTASNSEDSYFGMNAVRIEKDYVIILTLTVNSDNPAEFEEAMKIFSNIE